MRYHPGRILQLFKSTDKNVVSSDTSTQVTLEMWDENVLTLAVHKNLQNKIKTGDIVMIDYSPISKTTPIPRMEVCKILKGETGKKLWRTYASFHRKRRNSTALPSPPEPRHAYG